MERENTTDASRRHYGPQEIRVAIEDARRAYEDADERSSASPVTAFLLGRVKGLEDALASVKWEEYGLG